MSRRSKNEHACFVAGKMLACQVTQKGVAEELGTTQPKVSKAINPNNQISRELFVIREFISKTLGNQDWDDLLEESRKFQKKRKGFKPVSTSERRVQRLFLEKKSQGKLTLTK